MLITSTTVPFITKRNGVMDQPGFDVYANEFIPSFLRIINEGLAAPHEVYSTNANTLDVNYAAYVQTFAGSSLLPKEPSLLITEAISDVALESSNYATYLHRVLRLEFEALNTQQHRFNLYRTPLPFISPDPSGNSFIGQVVVPGVSEYTSRPYVRLGDTVILRQVLLDPSGLPLRYQTVLGPNRQPLVHGYAVPGWNGREHQAIVLAINMQDETLTLKVPGPVDLPTGGRPLPLFNFGFPIPDESNQSLWKAVNSVDVRLMRNDSDEPRNWITKMLFPSSQDGAEQRGLNNGFPKRFFYDSQLNFEQAKAVESISRRNYGTVPFLISGPPGTGKTKTLVETALQLALPQKEPFPTPKKKHIIMCAPSDPAADTLVMRLKDHFPPAELFRLNAPSRSFASVPSAIMQYTYVHEGNFSIPQFQNLMHFHIVVTTCRDAHMLVKARLTNCDLYALEKNLQVALHPEDTNIGPQSLHWDALLMDEAGQAIEAEALIPMTVVAPPENGSHLSQPQLVLVGDHKQLGPRTASQLEAIQLSLFERLLSRPFFMNHPLARHVVGRTTKAAMLTKDMLPMPRPAFANLIRNYRSHPAILAIPNSLFYHDTLLAEATDTDSLLSLPFWRGRAWPVLFCCNIGDEELERDGGGWYNVNEVMKATVYTQFAISSGQIRQEDICIMSPFQSQVKFLRKEFRKRGFYGVNIGPMEAFQGLESRLVIVCTTRSRSRFLDQDRASGMGLVHEPKRFNVAITRAKQGLIVIGNPQLLHSDPSWCTFMDFCRRNQLWEGVEPRYETNLKSGSYIYKQWQPSSTLADSIMEEMPALEKDLIRGEKIPNGRQLGHVAAYDDEMWVKGVSDALPGAEDEGTDDDDGYDDIDGAENSHDGANGLVVERATSPEANDEDEDESDSDFEKEMVKPRLRRSAGIRMTRDSSSAS